MLTNEWIDRIKKYKDKLKETFYENICQLDFLGFKTKEHLTYEEAMEKTFSDIGEFWGEMNEYCWFKTKIKLDEKYRGKIICLDINNCSEGLVFIDGKPVGTRRADWVRYKHQYISDLVLNKLV